jgi:hypothetical protein
MKNFKKYFFSTRIRIIDLEKNDFPFYPHLNNNNKLDQNINYM